MNKSVVIVGPAGCGKTRNAEAIRNHLGLDFIMDDQWQLENVIHNGHQLIANGVLYLTQEAPPASAMNGALMMTYADVAHQAGF